MIGKVRISGLDVTMFVSQKRREYDYKKKKRFPPSPSSKVATKSFSVPQCTTQKRGARISFKKPTPLPGSHTPSFTTGGWRRIYNPPLSSSCHGDQTQSFHSFWYREHFSNAGRMEGA